MSQDILHHGPDYTPYEGFRVTGWPVTTLVRGEVVVADGKLVGRKGAGQHLARDASLFAAPVRPVTRFHSASCRSRQLILLLSLRGRLSTKTTERDAL